MSASGPNAASKLLRLLKLRSKKMEGMVAAARPDNPVAIDNAVVMSFGCIGFCPGTEMKFPAPADQAAPLVFM